MPELPSEPRPRGNAPEPPPITAPSLSLVHALASRRPERPRGTFADSHAPRPRPLGRSQALRVHGIRSSVGFGSGANADSRNPAPSRRDRWHGKRAVFSPGNGQPLHFHKAAGRQDLATAPTMPQAASGDLRNGLFPPLAPTPSDSRDCKARPFLFHSNNFANLQIGRARSEICEKSLRNTPGDKSTGFVVNNLKAKKMAVSQTSTRSGLPEDLRALPNTLTVSLESAFQLPQPRQGPATPSKALVLRNSDLATNPLHSSGLPGYTSQRRSATS
jgi:hypothetical protein